MGLRKDPRKYVLDFLYSHIWPKIRTCDRRDSGQDPAASYMLREDALAVNEVLTPHFLGEFLFFSHHYQKIKI